MAEAGRFDTEAILRVSEARYRSLVETISSVVWTTDAAGRFVEAQASWEAYTGQGWAGHAGFGWAEMVHPDDRGPLLEIWSRSAATGETYEAVARIHHGPSGRHRWCDVRAAPVCDADGEIREWVGTITDAHDRRTAEHRASEAAARIDALLRRAPIGLAFFDTDLRFVMLNESLAELTGAAVDEHLGRRLGDVVPDLAGQSDALLGEVLESGEPALGLELSVETAARPGERRDLLVNYFAVHDDDREVLGVGATVVDVTERTRAEQRLAEERQVVETLNWVGSVVSAELDLERLVQSVTDAATVLTSARFGAFFYNVVDADGARYQLYALSGAPPDAFRDFGMPHNTPMFAPTFAGDAVIRAADVTADPRYGAAPPHFGLPEGHPPVRSYLAVPVVSRSGEVLGGLFFGHEDAGVFDERDELLAVGIAAQASVAMDNAALYEAVRRAEHRQSLLARAGAELTTSLEPSEVLRRIAAVVVPELADVCEVDLLRVDGKVDRFVHTGGRAPRQLEEVLERQPLDPHGDHPVAQVLRTGEPLLLRDVPDPLLVEVVDGGAAPSGGPAPVRRAVVVPLEARGQVIGVLSLVAGGRERRFDEGDLELAEDLADRTAVALDNARLFAQQRDAAVILQRSLLPAAIVGPPGLEVAVRYLPGGEGVEVGGDWYDVVALGGGRVALAVGDVMGRGIPAAARMGELRNGLRAYLLDERGPADALARLQRFADRRETFVTIGCAVLDPATRTLAVANAGHLPPLLLAPGADPRYLDVPMGVPVGTVVDAPFEEASITLPPEATVVWFTDGLVERRAQSLDVGLEQLRRVAADAGGQPDLDTFTDVLLEAMLGRPVTTADDVAVLAVYLP